MDSGEERFGLFRLGGDRIAEQEAMCRIESSGLGIGLDAILGNLSMSRGIVGVMSGRVVLSFPATMRHSQPRR